MVVKSAICLAVLEGKSHLPLLPSLLRHLQNTLQLQFHFFRGPSRAHTLSMRCIKILFFYLIPLVSTWITKLVLKSDHQISKLHSSQRSNVRLLLMHILGELSLFPQPPYKVCLILSSAGNPFSPPKMDMLYIIVSKKNE